ncbi:MAG: hypothetical protein KF729_09045 [Sandaracinaceae bacterium]|nr:hypothetical protein [Sandaracinaceae bacterium]
MARERGSWLVLWALGASLAGCWGNEPSAFPAGLEPLEDNPLPPLAGTADEPFPEGWALEGVDGPRHDTVYARGYLAASPAAVWAAFRDPRVGVDRRSADEWEVEPLEDPAYDEAYVIHATAYEIVRVDWSTTWRHGLVAGTPEAPELVAIRWQKTDGSTILRLIEGSLVLRATADPAVTELDLVYRVDALASGVSEYMRYVEDTLRDARAVVHGDPLPTFE